MNAIICISTWEQNTIRFLVCLHVRFHAIDSIWQENYLPLASTVPTTVIAWELTDILICLVWREQRKSLIHVLIFISCNWSRPVSHSQKVRVSWNEIRWTLKCALSEVRESISENREHLSDVVSASVGCELN